MEKRHLPAVLPLLVLLLASAPAPGAESYDNCTGFIDALPAVITSQGTWCLRKDLSTSIASASAITVAANNVTIDCNDFKLGGLGAGIATEAIGIYADGKLNATVRRCNVRGFMRGIALHGGGGHVAEDNRAEGNTYIGLSVGGDGSVVRRNLVRDTGGSPNSGGIAVGIEAVDQTDVLDNTVSGVLPAATGGDEAGIPHGDAYGIRTGNLSGTVGGNRVRGLVPVGIGVALGIHNEGNGPLVVRDNDVVTHAGSGGGGILCGFPPAVAKGNVIAGFEFGITGCTGADNEISN